MQATASLSVETTEPESVRAEFHASFTPGDDLAIVPSTTAAGSLTIVTTDDCHFCERAHEVLERLGVSAREIGVYSDEAAALAARGVPLAFLPVLLDGERVVAYGRFSEQRLRAELGS